jgi:hypothetical protein
MMQLEMQLGTNKCQRGLTHGLTYVVCRYKPYSELCCGGTRSTLSLLCPCPALCQVYMGLEAKLGAEAAGDISLEVSSPGGQCAA